MLLDFSIRTIINFAAFYILWYSSGLIFDSVRHLSKQIRMSSFATSFFILGILTSVPEFSVGINAIIDQQPSIFVGNLLGATLAMFAFVIPILAIFGRQIHLSHQLTKFNIQFSLFIAFLPALFVLDGKLTHFEAFICIIAYGALFFIVEKKKSLGERIHDIIIHDRQASSIILLKIITGGCLVFFASNLIVGYTIYISYVFNISSFIVSLLVLGIGTNLPEISVAIRSILDHQEIYAFGDYVGSAASNTFFFGILILIQGNFNIIGNHFYTTFIVMALILTLFYLFIYKDNRLTRNEGLILLGAYILFLLSETLL